MLSDILIFIRDLYDLENTGKFISLHEPNFSEKEFQVVNDCLRSTFVSSTGLYVDKLEQLTVEFTGIPYAVATVNGTSALHLALHAIGVRQNDLVLTQALSFVATANPIKYLGADPIFIDSATNNLGMCPEKLECFLSSETELSRDGVRLHKASKKRIQACLPMHVFGHPVLIEQIATICEKYQIDLIEDAAEALGSCYKGKHVGHHGKLSILSYNGNKIITSGGGGMVMTSDPNLAKKLKHLSTTAKVAHGWEFYHDEIGFNFRLPNLNAALACAQMERLPEFIKNKRATAHLYKEFFAKLDLPFLTEPNDACSNYWLNAIFFKNHIERENFLKASHEAGIMTRPIWKLLPELPMYKECLKTNLDNAKNYEQRLVNIPSSVRKT